MPPLRLRVARVLMTPYRWVPNGRFKDAVRTGLFGALGASPVASLPWLRLPRKSLLIDPGDTAVVVGAQSEDRVPLISRLVGGDGTGVFIEPAERSYETLARAATRYDNIDVVRCAAWNEHDTYTLYTREGSYNAGRIGIDPSDYDVEYDRRERVTAKPLDDVLADRSLEPDYVEVMVNWTELPVLEGGISTFRTCGPRLLIKGYGAGTPEDDDVDSIVELLESQGYRTVRAPITTSATPHGPEGDVFAHKPD